MGSHFDTSRFSLGIALQMPNGGLSDEDFYAFCLLNPELRIERTADNYIVIMPPTNSETGRTNFKMTGKLFAWNEQTQLGEGFDSSTGFKLPNGADRSPDLSWIVKARWEAVPLKDRQRFAPICPDFVVEIRSGDQNLGALHEKMEEYRACGCRLGWLIDPTNREAKVYLENGDPLTVPFSEWLDGGAVLPGFRVRLEDIWGA